MDRKEMTERFLEAYRASGKSYADLSRATGIPKSMIQRYFAGTVEQIPIDRLRALCEELDIDLDEILGWEPALYKLKKRGLVYRTMTPQQAVLFDASEDLTPKERDAVLAMIEAMRSTRKD